MSRLVLMMLLTFLVQNVFAQGQLKGTVKDIGGKSLQAASITLKNSDGTIVTFTRSNEKGQFTLAVPTVKAGQVIEANLLGYKKSAVVVQENQISYNFTLEESAIQIKDVVIKNKPVLKTSGDTLSYRVKDFSNDQDRVIGDVLKSMPGMQVADNGKVSYNGKNISNFYINGDNMLDDKYNIATKTIPKEAVESVQVIEKDQPIKMLRGKTQSDDVAINITTTEKAKFKPLGQVSLGGGLPGRFDENASIMLFGNKYKGINYLKGNNIGIDPAQDLIAHNIGDFLRRIDNSKPNAMLSGGSAGNPDLPQNRYLFNQAALLNVNNLFKFKNDVQFKTNAYYMADKQTRDYNKLNETYVPGNTFSFTEDQHSITRPNQLHASGALVINRDKSFISNTLNVDFNPSKFNIGMNANNVLLNQQLKRDYFDISNELNGYSTLKSGKIINFYSYLNRVNQPEELLISPGILPAQLNNGQSYTQLRQQVAIPTWFTNNYASLKFAQGKFSETYKAGVSFTDQQLNSSIDLKQSDNSFTGTTLNSVNQLNWSRSSAYAEGLFEFLGTKLSAAFTLPVSYQRFAYHDAGNGLNSKLDKVFLNPKISVKYQTGVEDYINLSYALRNTVGDITNVYGGAVLTNYRNIMANSSTLPEQQTNSAVINYNYRKAITLFFFSIQASYNTISSNTITSSIVTNNLLQRILLPMANSTTMYSLGGNVSKYWFPLRSTINGGINLSKSNSNQLINGNLLPFESSTTSYKAGLTTKISKAVNFNYTLLYSENSNASGSGVKTPGYTQMKQDAAVTATMFKNIFLNLSAVHLLTKQPNQPNLEYVFADASVRFKANKIKTDFEVGVTNLAGIKTYEAVYLSENSYTSAAYSIPGRVAMLKATFSY